MSGRDDGGPAFPIAESLAHQVAHAALIASGAQTTEDKDRVYIAAKAVALSGMSLRDHFAGLLMAAMFDGFAKMDMRNDQTARVCAREAYAVADAMIAERKA